MELAGIFEHRDFTEGNEEHEEVKTELMAEFFRGLIRFSFD